MRGVDAASLVSLPSAATTARASPSAQLALASARGQLEDWVTCPSAKTPEGQAKIRSIGVKIDDVKTQMVADARKPPRARGEDVYTASGHSPKPVGSRLDVSA